MKKLITLILLLSFTIKAQDVKIGKQTWTTKNLDVSKFRNGEAIPLAKTNAEWALAGQNGQPAWCYYNNDPANGTTYGKLYNWYAVSDPRGLAPNGYHIPTDKEWTTLTTYLGGDWSASTKMKSSSGWKSGNNTSGFNALPCGYRHIDGDFDSYVGPGGTIIFEGSDANWWGSSEASTRTAGSIRLDNFGNKSDRSNHTKSLGFSVRCIKDCSNDYPPNIELNKRNAEEKKITAKLEAELDRAFKVLCSCGCCSNTFLRKNGWGHGEPNHPPTRLTGDLEQTGCLTPINVLLVGFMGIYAQMGDKNPLQSSLEDFKFCSKNCAYNCGR